MINYQDPILYSKMYDAQLDLRTINTFLNFSVVVGMPTPSGASETKKLSGQMAQMSSSLSSNDKMMTSSSSSQLSPKKISDSKPNAMNKVNSAGNIMHQGNNNYNAQQQKQADQQQLQAKKRSQQQEQK